jgi:hypothetical protein
MLGQYPRGCHRFNVVLQPTEFPSVLGSYVNSVNRVFYFVAAMAAACASVLWGIGRIDVRKKDKKSKF